MELTKFGQKLNKLDGNIYTIEEIITPIDGIYEADLEHDNVDTNTINIYTGSMCSGDKVNTYKITTPSLTPWRKHIKVYSNEPVLYITYETTGDTVQADDVNNLQDAIGYTQEALNAETDRAIEAETQLQTNLDNEIDRAGYAELLLMNKINNEITRATEAENTIQTNLNNEITRATNREYALKVSINAETTRATRVEGEITTSLNAEISRAKSVENTLTTNLNNEVTRATKSEQAIQTTISTNKPIWDDKYTKAEIDNKISQVISNMDWKESVATYADIATTYPSPQDGWTVNVKDADITYRWDGSKWISISANAIPLATSSIDGKMSKTDKSFLDTVKGLWNSVTTHISDAVKHITSAERTLWNTVSNKAEKDHNHDMLTYKDLTGQTVDLNSYIGTLFHRYYRCTSNGGSVNISNKPTGDTAFILVIDTIRYTGESDYITRQTYIEGDLRRTYTRHYYSTTNKWSQWELDYNSESLTKVSQLTNDAGYITQSDIDTSQNHTHANKAVLDGITEDKITSWDGKLDKTGGTVTGRIICNGGTTVKSLNGGSGTVGYMYTARITVTRSNQDQPIIFDIQQRGRYGTVIFQFANSSSTDPALSKFVKRGNVEVYMMKVSAGVWDLYVKKSEGYDVIDIINMGKGEYMTYLNIEWKGITVTALPTGYVTAVREYMDVAVERANKDSDGNMINTTYVKNSDTNSTPFYEATELSANSYKVTTSFSRASLSDGYNLRVAIQTNATGATSLTVDSVTAPIKLSDGNAVSDLKAGGVYALTYYNGNFICASAGGSVDDVTFTSDKLLAGYTANNSEGKAIEGTMKNNGAPTSTLSCGGSYKLSEGYYSGGTISADSLASQTQSTATASNILKDKTAYANGNEITGTMNNKSGATTQWCGYETVVVQPNSLDPSQALVTIQPQYGSGLNGYYDTTSKINCNIGNLNAGNIKAGVKVGRNSSSGADDTNTITGTFTADATAGTLQIVPPYTAYVNGQKVTGTMNVMQPTSYSSGGNAQVNASSFAYGVYSTDSSNPYLYFGIPQWSYTSKNEWVRYPASSVATNIGLTANKIVSGNTILGITGTGGGKQIYTGTFTFPSTKSSVTTINLPTTANITALTIRGIVASNGNVYSGWCSSSFLGSIYDCDSGSYLGYMSISNGVLTIRRNTTYADNPTMNYTVIY